MDFKNYYSILGIVPQATQNEIAIAYKMMAKKWHPDKNCESDTNEQMQLISEAYAVLKDNEKRKKYNIEYYKIFNSKPNLQTNSGSKIELCYFCNQNIANTKFAHIETFYKETKRSNFPQRKVWYQTVEVKVPRCEMCNKIHGSGSQLFFWLPLLSFSILGTILGLTIWSMWLLCLIAGGFIGLIIGFFLTIIDDSIITKEAGIKKLSSISNFEPIVVLNKEGWSTIKPIA